MKPPGGVACVVVAAGSGTRLAAGIPKAFVRVGGRTLLGHAVARVRASGPVTQVVLVVPDDRVREVSDAFADAVVVAGGPTRQQSVQAGLRAIDPGTSVVLVHDAARALTPPATFVAVVDAVRSGHAVVVPAVELHDTVRSVGAGASSLVDRSTLRAVQTPQGFRRDVLDRAHADAAALEASAPATDDATLTERAGHRVTLVAGAPEAFQGTRPLDLLLAEAVVAAGPERPAHEPPAGDGSGAADRSPGQVPA